ncbi:unnamed protein product, partial [Linum tenue]
VNEECDVLRSENGVYLLQVTFGVLFSDDRCANIFEALVGTLRAAKKRKVVTYEGELLLQGVHDNVYITLLQPKSLPSGEAAATTPPADAS